MIKKCIQILVGQFYILLQIETLSADLVATKRKCEEVEVELSGVQDELDIQRNLKNNIEQMLTDKVHSLEVQINEVSMQLYMIKYYINT